MEIEVRTSQGARQIAIGGEDRHRSLADCLARHDMPLNTRCGQRGLCDGCLVDLISGKLVHQAGGQSVHANSHPVTVRACEHRLADEGAVVMIHERSLLSHKPQVVSHYKINVPFAHDPLIPAVGERNIGVAIDIGTTTVALLLVDLYDGAIRGQASGFNRQMHLGDNVVTRINLCSTDAGSLERLQHAVVHDTIARLLRDALKTAEIDAHRVAGLSIAGNTTMLHLLAGVDPSPMGISPFTPTFLEHRQLRGRDIHLHGFADAAIHLLPGASAYVGADLSAGIFATGLIYDEGPNLLVDVGTNGEIVLKHGDKLLGCATAAGPAFEGSGLTAGVRAGDGAVSHVRIDDAGIMHIEVIGDEKTKPHGLCGSAYVDLLGQTRLAGWLNSRGHFTPPEVAPGTSDDRFGKSDTGYPSLRIAFARGKKPIWFSEPDVSTLMQAKGAIAAGILTLLDVAGLKPADIRRLYLAGGFGMHMNLPNTLACGLLPGFSLDQIELVGNTSLAGAYIALLDRSAVAEMETFRTRMHLVELNLDPRFEDHYIDQLSL